METNTSFNDELSEEAFILLLAKKIKEDEPNEFKKYFATLKKEKCTSSSTLRGLSTDMWPRLNLPLAIESELKQWANSFTTKEKKRTSLGEGMGASGSAMEKFWSNLDKMKEDDHQLKLAMAHFGKANQILEIRYLFDSATKTSGRFY